MATGMRFFLNLPIGRTNKAKAVDEMMEELGMIQGTLAALADQMDSAVEEISALVDC